MVDISCFLGAVEGAISLISALRPWSVFEVSFIDLLFQKFLNECLGLHPRV